MRPNSPEAIEPIAIAYLPSRRRLDLATGEADIALRMRNLPDSDDLVARSLGRIAFAVYARSADISTVIVPPEDPHLSQQAALIGRYAKGRTIAARIGDMPIRYQAARSGLGAAVLPCWLGDSDPDLVPRPQFAAREWWRTPPSSCTAAAATCRRSGGWRMRSRLCSGRSRTCWREFSNLPHAEDDALRPLHDEALAWTLRSCRGSHRRTRAPAPSSSLPAAPPRADRAAGSSACRRGSGRSFRHLRQEHRQFEREMREDMAHGAGQDAASAPRWERRAWRGRVRNRAPRRWSASRPCRRGAPPAGGSAGECCHRPAGPRRPRPGAGRR